MTIFSNTSTLISLHFLSNFKKDYVNFRNVRDFSNKFPFSRTWVTAAAASNRIIKLISTQTNRRHLSHVYNDLVYADEDPPFSIFFFFFRQRPSARTFKFLYFLRFYRNDLKHSDDLKCIQRSSLDALHWEGETSLARGCHIFLLLSHRLIQLHKSFNHINGSKLRFFREQTNELLSK